MTPVFAAAAATAATVVGAALLALWPAVAPSPRAAAPASVTLAFAPYAWRPAGDFRRDGRAVDAPLQRVTVGAALTVMRHQVSRGEYGRCVADEACPPVGTRGDPALPQTNVSWQDATAYAAWLSRQTGTVWRLPTDAEWQRAAAERFADDAVGDAGDDPSRRWLDSYALTTQARGAADPALRQLGGFGLNSLGLADMAGNVWEWTDSCMLSAQTQGDAPFPDPQVYCGVRIAEGRHRAAIIDFVRDARTGGCGMGLPPDHLGFRLVRD